ncbi:TPA: S49 family peptidase [Yersinia enterocolitica]|nr:S49 family peptidase [Yersinia enterocolitica]HDL8438312.1 S49 family peptidase [Yersinia enterocolitica]HDM8456695.1 S49 family peptidase [Yersinia enterocolitica]HDW8047742.1 S49 family peptidase [Yersinia enterocolitica]HEF9705858.1 S49 family peptidase [Yersinia enterocolitica]
MPNWNQVMGEITLLAQRSPLDVVRKKYILQMSKHTGRNVIAYYSGFLQKNTQSLNHLISMTDDDKNGFMTAINGMDADKGLDLLIHTPGGDIAALESLGQYLRAKFGNNIRAIVPMIAMSAGTMLACCSKEIIMGKQSNIGPFDPQMGGLPAHGIIEEFEKAKTEILANPGSLAYWQFNLQKLHPTFIGECEKAIQWATEIVSEWLISGMFEGDADAAQKAAKICSQLNNHSTTYAHARHIHIDKARDIGLKITALEDDQKLQDLVLTIHHSYMHTFGSSTAAKIIENHNGSSMFWHATP